MAILIVDDETQTREALRNLLVQLGHKTILEAKNGEEALKMAEAEKARIQMIVSDLEMPYMDGLTLAREITNHAALDAAPFVLITSDLPGFRLANFQKDLSRIDATLLKPFRMSALSKCMGNAFVQRSSFRNQVLYMGKETPPSLIELFAPPFVPETKKEAQKKYWRNSLSFFEIEPFRNSLENFPFSVGAIFLDPTGFDEKEKQQLNAIISSFKKTPLGTATPLVCMSRAPREIFHFRTLCQFFINPIALIQDWQNILSVLKTGIQSAWEIDLIFQETKQQLQNKEMEAAKKGIDRILKLDPNNCDALCTAGDIWTYFGQNSEAIPAYEKVLHLNPALPRPYLKLFQAMKPPHDGNLLNTVEMSVQFCPKNIDILLAASQIFLNHGIPLKAKNLLNSVIKIQPHNTLASEMLRSLEC